MRLRGTNIPNRILRVREKRISGQDILKMVQDIYKKDSQKEDLITSRLYEDSETELNNFIPNLLEADKIFHLDDIEKICIDYRLRFLNSSVYKGELPFEAIIKIKHLEKLHNTNINGFKLLAPANLFKLKNADDPLLFAPIDNDYYYLIHSWGKDLHPFRKLLMWPFKHFENFVVFLLAISFLLTMMIPLELFSKNPTTAEFFMLFFFMFKWIAGMAIYYGFKKGKNFSSAIWRSKYFNA